MSQPYGKTGSTSGWPHNFLRSLTSFDFSQLNVSAGIRAGVLITSLLIIGGLAESKTARELYDQMLKLDGGNPHIPWLGALSVKGER